MPTAAKPPTKRRNLIATLVKQGFNGDEISAKLRINKNTLRARHALELKAARAAQKREKDEAAAAQPTKKEQELLDHIERSFASHWFDSEYGNLLYGGAHTIEEALAWVDQFKSGKFGDDV
jgi:hypothetical protein